MLKLAGQSRVYAASKHIKDQSSNRLSDGTQDRSCIPPLNCIVFIKKKKEENNNNKNNYRVKNKQKTEKYFMLIFEVWKKNFFFHIWVWLKKKK